jgi:hypothetical protein
MHKLHCVGFHVPNMTGISREHHSVKGKNKHEMLEYLEDLVHNPCSIGLYVSNLMRKFVPEKHFQMPDENHGTRRLTPDRIAFDAFGRCIKTEPNQVVSSLMVERTRIFDLGHPIGVMY